MSDQEDHMPVSRAPRVLELTYQDADPLALHMASSPWGLVQPSTPVFLLNTSLAIIVFKTAQLKAASPGGRTTKM